MNANYEKRLDALEARIVPIERVSLSIWGVWPGAAEHPEPIRASGDEWALDREPEESENDFINRASALAHARSSGNVASMYVECRKPEPD